MTESERGRERNPSRLEIWNPFHHGFDVSCVFKNLHEFEFVNVNPDRDQTLCPHHDRLHGDHPLALSETDTLSHVRFQYWVFSDVPVVVMLLNEQHCTTCLGTIRGTFVPTPPQKEWTQENVKEFYEHLLGKKLNIEPRFEPLRRFLSLEFPDEDTTKMIQRVDEEFYEGVARMLKGEYQRE